ncbi:MAG: DUF2125 domain-containing protein [Jannaschia sp.]
MPKHAIALSALLAVSAGPALADLSAQDLWNDWRDLAETLGATLTGTGETYADGRLSLDGFTLSIDAGDTESVTEYGGFAMVEQEDGSVRIDWPETMAVSSTTTIDGEEVVQSGTLTSSDYDVTVRDEGEERIYDFSLASGTYAFDDLAAGQGEEVVAATFGMTNLVGRYVNREDGTTLSTDQNFTADSVTIDVTGEGENPFTFDYALTDVVSAFAGSFDTSVPREEMTLATMGATAGGEITHSGSALRIDATSETEPVAIAGTSGSGSIGFDIGADTLGYTLTSRDVTLQVNPPDFPSPVEIAMAEATSGIALPVGVSDEAKPFALTLAYRDVTVDDTIWALFDPTGQLPRDAATILLDLSGSALMKADIFGDPEAMAALSGPPGELKTLDLTQLRVALAGAELRGSGAVEFPNPTPVPEPVGSVTLALDGGLALLDRLVALGFVPGQQATFVKGMIGAVARPVGEDQLESEIVFSEGGGISANGLPLR